MNFRYIFVLCKLQIPEICSGLKSQESSENRIPYGNSGLVPLKIPEYWGCFMAGRHWGLTGIKLLSSGANFLALALLLSTYFRHKNLKR
jgi:hypothetical protein